MSLGNQIPAATCKRCGALIIWLKTTKGKWMPCNNGKSGEIFDRTKHEPHWATCPDAAAFRKNSGGKQLVHKRQSITVKGREEPRPPVRAFFMAYDRLSNEAVYRGPNGEQIRLTEIQWMLMNEVPTHILFDPQTLKPILK